MGGDEQTSLSLTLCIRLVRVADASRTLRPLPAGIEKHLMVQGVRPYRILSHRVRAPAIV